MDVEDRGGCVQGKYYHPAFKRDDLSQLSTQLIIYQLTENTRHADLNTNGELSLKPSANCNMEIWTVSQICFKATVYNNG